MLGINERPRFEPSVGPLLPRIPSHQPSVAAADVTGAAVRVAAAAGVPRAAAGGAGQLRAGARTYSHCAHPEQLAGNKEDNTFIWTQFSQHTGI